MFELLERLRNQENTVFEYKIHHKLLQKFDNRNAWVKAMRTKWAKEVLAIDRNLSDMTFDTDLLIGEVFIHF